MLSLGDPGSGHLNGAVILCRDGTLAVDGLAQGVDNTPDESLTNRNGCDTPGTRNGVALPDQRVGAENDDGNGILFQILRHTEGAVGKFQQLAGHAFFQTRCSGDAVAHRDDHAGLTDFHPVFVVLDLIAKDFGDFFSA